MKTRIIRNAVVMLSILLFMFGISQAQETQEKQKALTPREVLKQHNISFNDNDLIDLLTNGYPKNTKVSDFPKFPEQKTQLLIYAIQELGIRKSKKAAPIISRYAMLDFPEGAAMIVKRDLELVPIAENPNQKKRLDDFLRYNAVTALGWIGDEKFFSTAKKVFSAETEDTIKIQYALTIGMFGDEESIPYLVAQTQNKKQTESVLAAKNFFYITGMNSGISINTPVKMREKNSKVVAEWWEKSKDTFKIEPADVQRRAKSPIDDMPKVQDGSMRDLLLRASFLLDFSNQMKSVEAREQLNKSGNALIADFEKIIIDPEEDLRIRSEALRRYAYLKGDNSKRMLKKLRDDENPEIADLAKNLLKKYD